jgi:uncharacterized protein
MKHGTVLALVAVLLIQAGCKGAGSEAATASEVPARHPQSGLALQELTVTAAGKEHRFRVEMAMTAEQQAQGMMFRTALGPDEGMLFPMNPPRDASFWMKNTVIPLDIIYIAPNQTIGRIAANTTPYSLDPIPSLGPVSSVLELRGGRAAELGLKPGDAVRW